MSKLIEGTPITLSAPIRGVNKRDPLSGMSPLFSPWMLNVHAKPQKNRVRNGAIIHSVVGSAGLVTNLGVLGDGQNASTNKLFAYVQDGSGSNKIYDVTASAESLSVTLADDTADHASGVNFCNRLAFAAETDYEDCSRTYDGSSWGSWGFTNSAAPIGSDVCCPYNSRMYIFRGTSLFYGGLEFVTGDTTEVDYQYLLNDYADIVWCGVLSSPSSNQDEVYLAFGTYSGEILVFGGDYPDSSTWSLVKRFKISSPVGKNSILVYRNDIWIYTKSGVVSLRGLFTNGSAAAEELTISSPIDPYWTELIRQRGTTFSVSGCFWPEKGEVWILISGFIDENDLFHSDVGTILVYDVVAESWSIFSLESVDAVNLGNMTYFLGSVYFTTANVVMKIGTGYKDETYNSAGNYSSYDFAIQGAYSSFGSEILNKKIIGLQPIFKTDFNGTKVGMRAAADFGRQVSDAAKIELVDGFNVGEYSVGAQGTFLQYRMEGESDTASTDGLELFAVAAILSPGGTR